MSPYLWATESFPQMEEPFLPLACTDEENSPDLEILETFKVLIKFRMSDFRSLAAIQWCILVGKYLRTLWKLWALESLPSSKTNVFCAIWLVL